jgi:hypothetical protein
VFLLIPLPSRLNRPEPYSPAGISIKIPCQFLLAGRDQVGLTYAIPSHGSACGCISDHQCYLSAGQSILP